MVDMDKKEQILHYHRIDGLSQREIARRVGVSRLTGMRKQCLKKQDIHRALIEKGFNISYSNVCKYIQQRKAEKSKKPKDVFVKQYCNREQTGGPAQGYGVHAALPW